MKFLRKLFIKNYDDVKDPIVREKTGILASCSGIFINLLLFIVKLTIGIISFSMSIISDAINNLTDLLSCFLNLFGFKMASRPADKRHPYGHERIEYITSLIISFIIVSVAIGLGYTAISNLINHVGSAHYDLFALIVLGVAITFKILLGFIYYSLGESISSESLKASMFDSFNDAICTFGVLIASIINMYVDIWWLDAGLSLVIALFILYSGIKSVLSAASPLIGVPPDSDFIKKISKDVLSYPIVLGIHDLMCHTYGHTKIFVILHAEVDGYQDIIKVHDEIDKIEQDMNKKYSIELTIHIDPIDTKNETLPILKKQIMEILNNIDNSLTIHDLRLVNQDDNIEVLFDIVKEEKCKLMDNQLKDIVKNKVESLNPSYKAIIKIDHKY